MKGTINRYPWQAKPSKMDIVYGLLSKIATLYDALFPLWNRCLETGELDRKVIFRVGGVKAQMITFLFIFGLQLDCRCYAVTDNFVKSFARKGNVSYFRSTPSQSIVIDN